MSNKKLWISLVGVLVFTFSILGFFGREVYRQAPPIPMSIVSQSGDVITAKGQILDGQEVWQSIGGQELGSIWGHGAYQAPDWTADWLHREVVELANILSMQKYNIPFQQLDGEQTAVVKDKVKGEFRTNTYNTETGEVTVSDARAAAIEATKLHYMGLQ